MSEASSTAGTETPSSKSVTESPGPWPGLLGYHRRAESLRQQGWHAGGQIWYDNNYERGKRHGNIREWDAKGNLIRDAWYEHGKWHGRHQAWYKNGLPESDRNYERDERHGRQQGWHAGGQVWYDNNYERGKQHGGFREWDTKGNLTTDTWYEHGTEWRDHVSARQQLKEQKDIMIVALLALAASYV